MAVTALQLAGGGKLPAIGLGFWKIASETTPQVVQEAIAVGYRHFDCACDYGNEAAVGVGLHEAFRSGTCRRQDLWITSKLWNTYHAREHVRPAVERSLRELQLDYVDLYLVHFPIALRYVPFEKRYPPGWFYDPESAHPRAEEARVAISETWRAMEDLVRAGLVKNIGVSNFNAALLRDLLAYAQIAPSVLQVELHPYLAQEKLVRFCHERQIAVTAFSPLGAASYVEIGMAGEKDTVMSQPAVLDAATRHGRSNAQVLLRWAIQRGTAAVPKTTRADRLRENLTVFDFELTAKEMNAISALDRGRRFNDPGVFGEAAFNTFMPIYD